MLVNVRDALQTNPASPNSTNGVKAASTASSTSSTSPTSTNNNKDLIDPEIYCKMCGVSFNSIKQSQQHYQVRAVTSSSSRSITRCV